MKKLNDTRTPRSRRLARTLTILGIAISAGLPLSLAATQQAAERREQAAERREQTTPVRRELRPELPREWVWTIRPVTFDGMFMTRR